MAKKRFLWLKVVGGLAALGLFAVISWAVIDTGLHATGDFEFCTSCHDTMAPLASSYKQALHGGNNAQGWRAQCVDCHLPHDNAFHHLAIKMKHGLVDPYMELTKDTYDIDWHGNRERRESYVYDSGCLSCHKYLDTQSQANSKAFRPHREYFRGDSGKVCVSCHEHVGHLELGKHLESKGWRVSQ
jgi:cytochrome c-type protein NapC